MKYADRKGRLIGGDTFQDKTLEILYGSLPGRILLKPLIHPCVSKIGAYWLESRPSRILIRPFIKFSGISLEECEKPVGGQYSSFNAFFTRRLNPDARPFEKDNPNILCSPCDGLVSACPIHKNQRFKIKHTQYTVDQLLRDKKLGSRYEGGMAVIFRLTVSDYHRYAYVDSGLRSSYRSITGLLHTVNPAAASRMPVYKENSREYCLIRTLNFRTIAAMEVGALMVGKIVNHHKAYTKLDVLRGQEKGYFAFGGSTVILLFQPDAVKIHRDILRNTALDIETKVRMGEAIGESAGQ